MADYFEIDLWDVESARSGDAISVRTVINENQKIYVTDAGFQSTGESVCNKIREHYGNPNHIDYVTATHPDGDHAGGLRTILEEFEIGELWMLRPWLYAEELIERFETYTSIDRLVSRLKTIYPNIAALEEIAETNGIPMFEPFQGSAIGDFVVLSPSKQRYLDLIVASEKTPESSEEGKASSLLEAAGGVVQTLISIIRAKWGEEIFSPEETSPENEMSVVQFATVLDKKILLTGDAGRAGLLEAADFADGLGLGLPGIDHFQVPHHGSRRNVSTEVLDRLLGTRLEQKPETKDTTFSALISASKEDEHHPRKAVERAMVHRGGFVTVTEGSDKRSAHNAPSRPGYSPVSPRPYPEEQESQ